MQKQVILIRSTPTYLRCIADQSRSKYDQPTLYRRRPRCTPAQLCGERDHPRPFFNRLKNLSRSQQPLRAGPTNPRCILDQHTLSPIKARSLPILPFFQSGRERGLIGSLVWTGLKILIYRSLQHLYMQATHNVPLPRINFYSYFLNNLKKKLFNSILLCFKSFQPKIRKQRHLGEVRNPLYQIQPLKRTKVHYTNR